MEQPALPLKGRKALLLLLLLLLLETVRPPKQQQLLLMVLLWELLKLMAGGPPCPPMPAQQPALQRISAPLVEVVKTARLPSLAQTAAQVTSKRAKVQQGRLLPQKMAKILRQRPAVQLLLLHPQRSTSPHQPDPLAPAPHTLPLKKSPPQPQRVPSPAAPVALLLLLLSPPQPLQQALLAEVVVVVVVVWHPPLL